MEKTILDWRMPILTVVDFLVKLYGGNINDLIKSVELCSARLKNVDDKELYKLLELMLPILDVKNNKLQVRTVNLSFKPKIFGKGEVHQFGIVYDLNLTDDPREIIYAKIKGYSQSQDIRIDNNFIIAGEIGLLNINIIELFLDCLIEIRSIHNQGETES